MLTSAITHDDISNNSELFFDESCLNPKANIALRNVPKYNKKQKDLLDKERETLVNQIAGLQKSGVSIFSNQTKVAKEINDNFKDQSVLAQMILGKTQSGKTGTMLAAIKLYVEDAKNYIPTGNIFIITGLSSKEWKEQTKDRMPNLIRDNIYHRNDLLTKFAKKMQRTQNALIIIDETQIAAQETQTIHKVFDVIGLLNKQLLLSRDIKILEFTATPDGVIFDLKGWKESSKMVFVEPGKGYVGASDLLKMGHVLQYKDLTGELPDVDAGSDAKKAIGKDAKGTAKKVVEKVIKGGNAKENVKTSVELAKPKKITAKALAAMIKGSEVLQNIVELKDVICKTFKSPAYHIIRTQTGESEKQLIDNFTLIFDDPNTYEGKQYNEESAEDINKLLAIEPQKHTFIFIKEMLRCAKTLYKKYIGVVYERHTKNPNDSAIIQGLLGRLTGYDYNGKSICFTNIESIEKYELLWSKQFENYDDCKWVAQTTKCRQGRTTGRKTFNIVGDSDENLEEIKTLEKIPEKVPEKVTGVYKYKIFVDQDSALAYYNANLKSPDGGSTIRRKKVCADGWFKEAKKVSTTKQNIALGIASLKDSPDANCKYFAGYSDIADQNTLQFIIVYKA